MDIEIKNEQEVISICEHVLSTETKELISDLSLLRSTLAKIKTKWQSNGLDRESYILELDKQASNLEYLNSAIVSLFSSILNYIRNIEETSSNTVDVIIGGNFENYNVTTAYDTPSEAITDTNPEHLLTEYVNENSTFQGFAIVDGNGRITNMEESKNVSLTDFCKENNCTIDDVAVIVQSSDGQPQAWLSAKDLVENYKV